jgi:hypothetical protein
MLHSSSRAICSNVSHRTSRHWNVRELFLFGSALIAIGVRARGEDALGSLG